MTRRTLIVNVLCAAALLVLLGAAVAAWKLDLGRAGLAVGLAIAAAKAVLIGAVFMELRTSRPLTTVFALAGLFWLAIMMTLTLADFLTR